jgi:hypothetical protein
MTELETPPAESALRELYWEDDLTLSEIADKYDRAYSTVNEWFQKKDIERVQPGGRPTKTIEKRRKVAMIKSYLPCSRCGRDYPSYVMDFHHRNPENKYMSISRMADGSRWGRIKQELRKCDLYCANCHRIVEHGEDHG